MLVLCNLKRELPSTTLIVVSHRLATVSACDRILVLSGGQILADEGPATLSSITAPRGVFSASPQSLALE
jgi:ABC-type multidrug transport system fused ATPase/permease subunit